MSATLKGLPAEEQLHVLSVFSDLLSEVGLEAIFPEVPSQFVAVALLGVARAITREGGVTDEGFLALAGSASTWTMQIRDEADAKRRRGLH